MHVLVISPTPTFPADQGNRQRVKHVCRALKERGATVHFGYFPREWAGRFSTVEHTEMTREWDYFDTIVPSKPFVYQTSDRYFGIDDWWDESIERFINYKCNGLTFDACIVNYAFFSKAFDHLPPNVVRILDTHDRLSGRRELLERNGVVPEFFYTTTEQERIALNRADVILAINPEEAAFFRTLTTKPVVTLGHVALRQEAPAAPRPKDAPLRVGFLGSPNSVNIKNINDFFAALANQAPDGIPNLEINIYGGCCARLEVPPQIDHYVKLRGRVDDIGDFYGNIDCVFVPFLFGTGQKIKLIEALAFGKPLIATASASEGSGSTTDMHLLTSFNQVIDALRRFAADSDFRARLAQDSVREFAQYESTIARAANAVFEIGSVSSMQCTIDPARVSSVFRGKSPADKVNSLVRVIAVLDLLDSAGRLLNKTDAVNALLEGIAESEGAGPEHSATTPVRSAATPTTTLGATQIVLQGLSSSATNGDAGLQLRVHLPENAEPLPPAVGPAIDLHVDCRPPSTRTGSQICATIRTPTSTRTPRLFERFEQIVVLTDDILATGLAALLANLTAELDLRLTRKLVVCCIDRGGRRARWDGKTLSLEVSDGDILETILNGRAVVLGRQSIMLALGISHVSAGPLHRVLIGDGGPLVSLVEGRVPKLEGEFVARSVHEAANWITHLAMAPAWASDAAERMRAAASSVEGPDTIARQIRAHIGTIKSKRLADEIATLARQESPRTAPPDPDLARLVQRTAGA